MNKNGDKLLDVRCEIPDALKHLGAITANIDYANSIADEGINTDPVDAMLINQLAQANRCAQCAMEQIDSLTLLLGLMRDQIAEWQSWD